MKNKIITTAILVAASIAIFSSCKKDVTNPNPDEQELITTVKLTLTTPDSSSKTYVYKIQNGFNSTTQGTVQIDTLRLAANTIYNSSVEILNEKASPVENTTEQIISEQTEHLFLYISTPASGNGSVSFTDGNKDSAGKPFNLTGKLTAAAAGTGSLRFYLVHQPTNKEATNRSDAGGESDVDATFPVVIQ